MCGHLTRGVHATGNQIPPTSHARHTWFALRRLESVLAGWLDQGPAIVHRDGGAAHAQSCFAAIAASRPPKHTQCKMSDQVNGPADPFFMVPTKP
jgi:hypothetical protein